VTRQRPAIPLAVSAARVHALVFVVIAVWLAIIGATRFQPNTFLFRDGSFYAQTNRAIATGLTLRQEAYQPASWYDGSLSWYRNVDDAWSNLSVGRNGEWYPKHSYVMPILSTPFYLVSGPAGLLVFNLIALGLALFSGYLLAARWVAPIPAAVATLAVLATPLVPYLAYSYSHDVLCATLAGGGLALVAGGRPATAGAVLGLALVAKVTNVLVIAPMLLVIAPWDRRTWVRGLAGASIPLALYAAANWWMYGAPWRTSYHAILTVQDGVQHVISYSNAFDLPLAQGFRRFFQPSGEGELWQMAAVPLVGFSGIVLLAFRTPRMAAGLAVALAAFLVGFGKYRYGGARFFMPWLVLAPIPMAALADGASRLTLAIRGAWRLLRGSRWGTAAIVLLVVAHAAGFGTAWVLRAGTPDGSPSMSRDIEALRVRVGDVPCDYLNMAHWKWECSRVDRNSDWYAGRAGRRECRGLGMPGLRVPPGSGGAPRVIEWVPDTDLSALRVVRVPDGGTKVKGTLKVELRTGDRVLVQDEWGSGAGDRRDERVEGPFETGKPIVLTVDPRPGPNPALCIEVVGIE
jgi:hypothetical protein